MKNSIKLLLIAFVALASLTSQAQSTVTFVKYFSNGGLGRVVVSSDTVTNTGTNYLSGFTDKSASTVTIQANLTKISGTVAGTVTLQGSLDGTNYVTVTGTATGVQTGTFTATNVASQSTTWTLVGNPYPWYRVTWTGTGTMAATLAASLYIR